ncbi:MAG: cellulose-binding domain-containing protein [Clostridia bacterium]|nr:cellulose-binding domain-containing protein [Clostridia bacterium]
MKKIRLISLTLSMIFLLSTLIPLKSFANSVQSVYSYNELLTSSSVLNDGDRVVLENQNSLRKSWLKWDLPSDNIPELTTATVAPGTNATGKYFRIKKLADGKIGFYVVPNGSTYYYFKPSNGDFVAGTKDVVPTDCQFSVVLNGSKSYLITSKKVQGPGGAWISALMYINSNGIISYGPGDAVSYENGIYFKIYRGLQVQVTTTITSKWDSGYSVKLEMKNMTSKAINNWGMEMRVPAGNSINAITDAKIVSVQGTQYIISNPQYVASPQLNNIPANGTITLTFNVNGTYSSDPSVLGIKGDIV